MKHPHDLKCKKCNKWRPDTSFPLKGLGVDTTECNMCSNPEMYNRLSDHVKNYLQNLNK